jgi:predicted transcriptional regulator
MILHSLIKHETLTITDIAQEGNLGVVPDKAHLVHLIKGLVASGHIHASNDIGPGTYTITTKGIQEGKRLQGL